MMIKNPVLTGFYPDPSILFVDDTFYIANSTFEYYPGVSISKSKDLANWEKVCYPVKNQINLMGNPCSCGVWAPCLSYCDGTFYLVFTDVKLWCQGPHKDAHNFIITAKNIEGPWSDPIYINSSGFDPSLFHSPDGKKYFVNMEWDYRKETSNGAHFTGILLTELDPVTLKPVSEPVKIFTGSEIGLTEGPHIYKKDDYYYLLVAEGGTSYEHAATIVRSENIYGPYELTEESYLISSKNAPNAYLQKTGHSSMCCDNNGRWWLAFLCGRPVGPNNRCPLGRETSINELVWENGWPHLKNGTSVGSETFEGYDEKNTSDVIDYPFSSEKFVLDFQSLRHPATYTILENGDLRLYGKEFFNSTHNQNILVTRQTKFSFQAELCVENKNHNFKCMGGLLYRYSENNQYYLRFAFDETLGKNALGILMMDDGNFSMPIEEIPISSDTIYLRLTVDFGVGIFSYSLDGENWTDINYKIDVTTLSDEYERPMGFTGAFVGMACQDLQYNNQYCDFRYFRYR